jgi:CheY-like chemotaxis protein
MISGVTLVWACQSASLPQTCFCEAIHLRLSWSCSNIFIITNLAASQIPQVVKRLQRQTFVLDDNIRLTFMETPTMYKVLTIDDDPAMTELLTLLLKMHGLDAYMANSGEDGLKLVRKLSPDVIILDLMMPDMDGWQVCTQVRAFSKVPIIVLSALDSPGIVASALDAGADDYLVKPVPSGVLIAHLNNLTRRAATEKINKDQLTIKPMIVPA